MTSRSAAPRYLSPLRYPGGKDKLAGFVASLIDLQPARPVRYVEPFAGGAAVGLRLLFSEVVDEIVLNDLEPGVAAFWRAVFDRPTDLASIVRRTKPTLREWKRQQALFSDADGDDVELGFAAFFLNRTNRSGILNGRPIGGFDQSGAWRIDARYNPGALAERIERLGQYRSRVSVLEVDGVDLIASEVDDPDTFVYADPPYLRDGDRLYMNDFRWEDHEDLSNCLASGGNWLLTYDDDARVVDELYPTCRCAVFDLVHTAATRHVGREYAVFSPSIVVGDLDRLGSNARFL